MPAPRERRTTTAGRWLFAALVPGSALALGSLHTTTLAVVTALSALGCGLLWYGAPLKASKAGQWVLAALLLLVGFTLLQLVPLPAAVVRVIASENADIWARALRPLQEAAPSFHPITVAPAATRVQLVRGLFYACMFLSALRIASAEGGKTFLERVLIISAVVAAVVSLAHPAVQARSVFGLYRPREAYAYVEGRYGPLLNSNHLAAYLGLGACVALGSALSRRRAAPTALLVSAVMFLVGTNVWAASRGGAGALVLGVVLVAGLSLYARRSFDSALVAPVVVLLVLVASAVMFGLAGSDFARQDLSGKDLSKLALVREALKLVARSPWVGFGRGAFETVFPLVRESDVYVTFTNPENVAAQWATEWGLPVSLVAAGMLARALQPQHVLAAVHPAIGAWGAIVATLVHEVVDFHLENPGVVAAVMVCVALLVSARRTTGRGESRPSGGQQAGEVLRLPVGKLALGAAASAVVAAAWVVPDAGHMLSEDRHELSVSAVDARVPDEAFERELRAAIRRYPAEAFFPLLGAVRAHARGESVVPWVASALERNPRFGRAHLVLARSLAPRARAQARLEYRLAYENDARLRGAVVKEALPLVDGPEAARELVPEGELGAELLEALVGELASRMPATAAILDAELARRSPDALGVLRRRVQAGLNDVVHEHPWCPDGKACLHDAVEAADLLVRRDPSRCASHVLLAEVRLAVPDVTAALDELERSVDRVAEPRACLRELVRLSLHAGARVRADAALERAVRLGCGRASECVELYAWAAGVEEGRGNVARAVTLYKRAVQVAPERDDFLEKVGELGARVGMTGESMNAYAKLQERHPEDPRWPARVAELRARLEAIRVRAPR